MARHLSKILLIAFGILSLVLTSPFSSSLVKHDFPDPQDMIGNWTDGLVHDPSIIRRPDGKWFMVHQPIIPPA